MKNKVNEQAQKFHLATTTRWESSIGHKIQVGTYRFCAVPLDEHINVSEVTTSFRVINVPLTQKFLDVTSTKKDALRFFSEIGERLKSIIYKVENSNKLNLERSGEMPPIENVDTNWITEEISDVMH